MRQLFRSELFRTVGFFAILTAICLGVVFAVFAATDAWVDSSYPKGGGAEMSASEKMRTPTPAATAVAEGSNVTPSTTPTPVMALSECQQAAVLAQKEVEKALEELGFEPDNFPHVEIIRSYYKVAISPRERIDLVGSQRYGAVSVEELLAIEAQIEASGEYSGFGGEVRGYSDLTHIGLACADVKVMVRILAHEWAHSYLRFSKFGIYLRDFEEGLVVLIETEITAAIYKINGWGELPPRPSACENEKLRPVREKLDVLLAEGKVEEAEAFMEAERQRLCRADWCPRRLNQAFFAGCEAYVGGAEGDNPIPRMVRELRESYPTLKEFLDDIKMVGSYEEFLDLYESRGINPLP